ncbi:MAG: hypothetical protein E7C50_00445 [Clostridium sp.]|uniref:hypothetical protein n=1 Tax=Clostridium sp. TaxID=1506 RepID=UPI002903142C|nr:hypothetical protein [Clostridium sp.]MDU2674233.1 hypothetical protein [Clostridium sp.]MDU2680328.1 hypothetical protein [Clostridium sp.]
MFIKNKLANFYILVQIKIYKILKRVSPYLAKVIEGNINKKAKSNFLDILEKLK